MVQPEEWPFCLVTDQGRNDGAERRKRDESRGPGKTENARRDNKPHERHNRIVHCTVTECPIPAALKPYARAA